MYAKPILILLFISTFLVGQPEDYRVETGEGNIRQVLHVPEKLTAMAVSGDRKQLALCAGETLFLAGLPDGALEKTIEFPKGDIRGAAFLKDDRQIALAGVGGVFVYEIASGTEAYTLPGHPNSRRPGRTRTHDILELAEAGLLATISEDESNLRFWVIDDRSPGTIVDTGIKRPKRLAKSPDGAWLAVSGQGILVLYRTADMQEVRRNDTFGVNPTMAFSPDSRLLAVGDDGGGADVIILDVESGEESASRYVGSARVGGIAWTSAGKIITAPARMGFGIYVYDLNDEKEQPLTIDKKFLATEDVDAPVVVGGEDRFLVVAGKKGEVRVYALGE